MCVCARARADACVSIFVSFLFCFCVHVYVVCVCVHVFMFACVCARARVSGLLVEGAYVAALAGLNVCDVCMTCVCERGSFLGTIPPCIGCNVCNIYVYHAESLMMCVLYKAEIILMCVMYAAHLSLSLLFLLALSRALACALSLARACARPHPHPPPENSKKLHGVDDKLKVMRQDMDDELKGLKESIHRVEEAENADDESDRKVKRSSEEEFAMQMGWLRRVIWRSCMRNTSAPCVAFGADCALVELAGYRKHSLALECNSGGAQTDAQDCRGWEAHCPGGCDCCSRREFRDRAGLRCGPRRRRAGASAAHAQMQIVALFLLVC